VPSETTNSKRPNRVRIDLRLPSKLLEKLDEWCEAQPAKTTRTGAIEGAIRLLLKTYSVEED
jgi:metal-responsive CopG/Arc/MetJ family transcriptional regulator